MVVPEGSARTQRFGVIFPNQLFSETRFLLGLASIYADC